MGINSLIFGRNEAECIEQIVKEIVSKLRWEQVGGEVGQKDVEFGSKFLEERVLGFTRSAASPCPLCAPVFFFVTIYSI